MDFRYAYWANVRTLARGSGYARGAVSASFPFEFERLPASDCVTVATYDDEAGFDEAELRWMRGGFHVRLARPEGHASDAEWLAAVAADVSHADRGALFPGTYAYHGADPPDEGDTGIRVSDKGHDREDAMATARRAAAAIVLVDGEAWASCPEPVLSLEDGVGGAPFRAVVRRSPSELFPALRLDRSHALEAVAARLSPGVPVAHVQRVDVLAPDLLRLEPERDGLLTAAADAVKSLGRDLAEADMGTMEAYVRLRGAVRETPPDPETVLAAATDVLSLIGDRHHARHALATHAGAYAATRGSAATEDEEDVAAFAP